ncbi:hypothetical protein [Thioclava indica]|uniref:Uncharacterized protein n=1 Tax=Thioclava indica TaxID=1353528 RepID=A0A074J8S2_9RHOB|nr:hypothetical protein [Thioclava indica]KEO53951.1 hypothetical protein DT23_07190 [Thioclava indica]
MRRIALTVGLWVFLATLAGAQGWHEPKRGTAERKALMDALRGPAQSLFGAPVEFVVGELRVSGNLAFAMVRAQRPGGIPIQIETTPGWARNEFLYDADHTSGQALYRKEGGRWVVKDYTFGATDVWWSYGPICKEYRPVIADACQGM